jgi:hypothetical protein
VIVLLLHTAGCAQPRKFPPSLTHRETYLIDCVAVPYTVLQDVAGGVQSEALLDLGIRCYERMNYGNDEDH